MGNNVIELVSSNQKVADEVAEFDHALGQVMEAFVHVHPHDKVAILEATKVALLITTMVDIEE